MNSSMKKRSPISRKVVAAGVMLVAVAVGFGTTVGAAQRLFPETNDDSDPPVVAQPDHVTDMPEESACGPVMDALAAPSLEFNPLTEIGIESDQIPNVVLENRPASLVCLADELTNRVEAIYIPMGTRGLDGGILLLTKGTPALMAEEYFPTVLPELRHVVEIDSGIFMASASDVMDRGLDRIEPKSESSSLWGAIVDIKSETK